MYKAIVYLSDADGCVQTEELESNDFQYLIAWAQSFGTPNYNLFEFVGGWWQPVQTVPQP
jgi:hypothetical protein